MTPPESLVPPLLLRSVRIVPVGAVAAPRELVDLRVRAGVVTEVAARLRPVPDEQVHEAEGRWAIPGLWDHHVHLAQWADTLARVDMSGTASPQDVLDRLAAHLGRLPTDDRSVVVGFGHRSALWTTAPTVAALDAVSGDRPVILVSGDGHHGWLDSAALRLMGLPPTDGPVVENDWYPVFARLSTLPTAPGARETAYRYAVQRASALGIVGVGDMEFGPEIGRWRERWAAGVTSLRVRQATYLDGLDAVLAEGLRSGDDLCDSGGLVQMGPLKIISDGSLNTRSAWCHEPYAGSHGGENPCGWPNFTEGELREAFTRARAGGLSIAIHAIGDAAIGQALDTFAATGAVGGIEHAQLVTHADVARMAALGISASVQPAHLLDDRDVAASCWPDRQERCYPFRSMLDAGVALRLGSDAPISPLDPWLAMAAAVHRSADERPPWTPAEGITAAEALAASTDGQPTIGPGSRADLVLLDADPLAAADSTEQAAAHLRRMPVAATFLCGRQVHPTP